MLRPEPTPVAIAGSPPADDLDTSCMNCFSRRVGLIAIGWTIVWMSILRFFTTIEYLTVMHGGTLVITIIFFVVNLADGWISGLLLLALRDCVVRVRLNMWLVWNIAYSGLCLIVAIVDLCTIPLTSGLKVLEIIKWTLLIGFRVFCLWTGWRYRGEVMSLPQSANQIRPESGRF